MDNKEYKNRIITMLFRMNNLQVSMRDVSLYLHRNEDALLHSVKNYYITESNIDAVNSFLDEYELQGKVKVGPWKRKIMS